MPKSKPPTTNYQSLSTPSQSLHNCDLEVAIVHDWLIGGGAELVVEQLHELFPDAPIYTSYCSPEWRKRLNNQVKTGYLQHWPFNKLRKFLPVLRILWFRKLKLDQYDLVISSSGNGEAKHILPTPSSWKLAISKWRTGTKPSSKEDSSPTTNYQSPTTKIKRPLHISYIHAPTHFYWRHYDQYLKQPGFGIFNPLARIGLKLLVKPLRKWDYQAAQRPHRLLANSTHTQSEIDKFYGRKSTVVHPPVYLGRFSSAKAQSPRKGFIIAGRQTPYKRFDIAVRACTKLNLPLTVIGTGPEHEKLKKIAGRTITFLGRVSDHELEQDLAAAEAFIFPAYEDFGIAPVEALASGTPVIAYKAGGALDYVQEGRTGLFFKHQTVDSLISALERFPGHHFRPEVIIKEAQAFSKKNFHKNIIDYLDQLRKI